MNEMPQPACFNRITLEMSLKPFVDLDDDAIRRTCRRAWSNWRHLLTRARTAAVLLWVGDGSEILEWRGDFDQPIRWASTIGFCNYDRPGVYPQDNPHYRANQAVPYRADVPVMRYRDLKRIIDAIRETGHAMFGQPIEIGATIDPGPEFVDNDFRFVRHPELLTPGMRQRAPRMMHFITHHAHLRADPEPYAGFPQGAPEGTSLGTFLGRQFEAAARDLGFDYLWFSNGFGYSPYAWCYDGEVFDGSRFDPQAAGEQLRRTNAFWRDFREACPDRPVAVRGTNFSVGMDLSTDGCSHQDIWKIGRVQVPPTNPPWGSRAIGLEMVSYLSRLAKTPSGRLPFRFYANDPWFAVTPWYDYYNREPFDIYIPMAAGRIDDDGRVQPPNELALLSIDTSRGELLADQSAEITPHLLRALDERADAPGPLVWVYPFDEYEQTLKRQPDRLGQVFAGDWFICQAVNAGLPLNTVCSSDRFVRLAGGDALRGSIIVTPVPNEDWGYTQALLRHVSSGGAALLYGSLEHASADLLAALGVQLAQPLEGDFQADVRLAEDRFERAVADRASDDPLTASIGMAGTAKGAEVPAAGFRPLRHRAIVSGGGLGAVCGWDDPAVRVVAEQSGQKRVYALSRAQPRWNGGRLMWIAGTVSFDPRHRMLEPVMDAPGDVRLSSDWPRRMLADCGLDIVQERRDESVRPATVFIKRHRGAWYFVGHKPNTTAHFFVKTADGAPVWAESETRIRDGYAAESFGKSFYSEVRAFVKMRDGIVAVKELSVPIGRARHLCISGLTDAAVTIYPDPAALAAGRVRIHPQLYVEQTVPYTVRGEAIVVEGYSGSLYVTW